MGAPPVRVDMFRRIQGLDFDQAFSNHLDVEWDGVQVSIIGRDDLIAAKRAAGRPQDLLDVESLEQAGKKKPST